MSDYETSPIPASAREVDAVADLIRSASVWIGEAMTAWANDAYGKVAALAPLAVEHLGKAVLWRANPVLLVPLAPDAEASLMALATKPSLAAPKLRTVGMAAMLNRLEGLMGALPIDRSRRRRLVESRNGAMHVGTSAPSRDVLLDALALCQGLLRYLDAPEAEFFGEHHVSVLGLLDVKRTETGHRVAAKRARARQNLTGLEERLGTHLFEEMCEALEARARFEIDTSNFGAGYHGVRSGCPECGSDGLLIGTVDVDFDVDFDVEPLGGGQYEPVPYSITIITLVPAAFTCNVCKLELVGVDELSECGLPTARVDVAESELEPNFEIGRYIYGED